MWRESGEQFGVRGNIPRWRPAGRTVAPTTVSVGRSVNDAWRVAVVTRPGKQMHLRTAFKIVEDLAQGACCAGADCVTEPTKACKKQHPHMYLKFELSSRALRCMGSTIGLGASALLCVQESCGYWLRCLSNEAAHRSLALVSAQVAIFHIEWLCSEEKYNVESNTISQ